MFGKNTERKGDFSNTSTSTAGNLQHVAKERKIFLQNLCFFAHFLPFNKPVKI